MLVVTRVAHELALEERNVEDGRVEVDELEDEDLEGQVVVKLWLGPMHLWKRIVASEQRNRVSQRL